MDINICINYTFWIESLDPISSMVQPNQKPSGKYILFFQAIFIHVLYMMILKTQALGHFWAVMITTYFHWSQSN